MHIRRVHKVKFLRSVNQARELRPLPLYTCMIGFSPPPTPHHPLKMTAQAMQRIPIKIFLLLLSAAASITFLNFINFQQF